MPERPITVTFACRLARHDDIPAIAAVMAAAIGQLQAGFLDPDQIAASNAIMGLDTQLIDDGTYFVIESDDEIAGCGGWSRRATRYGADHTAGRDDRLLDPRHEAAKVRAMYTNPRFARRGVGRTILDHCEHSAAHAGFRQLELIATLAGEPLYRGAGFKVTAELVDTSTGTPIPLRAMTKRIATP
jgi:GNAT superfamily N-acetyltransferase